jgi:hypothetical protein
LAAATRNTGRHEATLYQAIGIDPSMTFLNGSGRPMVILDDREPVVELL